MWDRCVRGWEKITGVGEVRMRRQVWETGVGEARMRRQVCERLEGDDRCGGS